MKKKTIVLLMLVTMIVSGYSQTKKAETIDQYEYLVISFGKTYYDDLKYDDKYYFILSGGDIGLNLNKNLNIMGRLGWELIDTIGAISGDQQLILKRKKGLLSEEAENELIEQIKKEQYEVISKAVEELTNENDSNSNNPLIETDNRDWMIEYEKNNKIFSGEIQRLAELIGRFDNIAEVSYDDSYYIARIDIKYNLTNELLRNNEYSLTEVKNYVSSLIDRIRYNTDFDNFTLYSHSIKLSVSVVMTYEGKEYIVYDEDASIEKSYR